MLISIDSDSLSLLLIELNFVGAMKEEIRKLKEEKIFSNATMQKNYDALLADYGKAVNNRETKIENLKNSIADWEDRFNNLGKEYADYRQLTGNRELAIKDLKESGANQMNTIKSLRAMNEQLLNANHELITKLGNLERHYAEK